MIQISDPDNGYVIKSDPEELLPTTSSWSGFVNFQSRTRQILRGMKIHRLFFFNLNFFKTFKFSKNLELRIEIFLVAEFSQYQLTTHGTRPMSVLETVDIRMRERFFGDRILLSSCKISSMLRNERKLLLSYTHQSKWPSIEERIRYDLSQILSQKFNQFFRTQLARFECDNKVLY